MAGLAVLMGVAGGCGGSDGDTGGGGTATAQTVAATTAPAGQDCGAAQAEIEASLTGMGAVTSVEVPSCDKAVVTTTLGADESDQAASLCQNAANEAGPHGVGSVSVVSTDGQELARGTNSEDCRAA